MEISIHKDNKQKNKETKSLHSNQSAGWSTPMPTPTVYFYDMHAPHSGVLLQAVAK